VRRRYSGYGLVFISLWLLSGCSHTPGLSGDVATTANQPEHWSMRGRLSVVHGEKSWSGGLRWHHLASGDELTIRDPIGRMRLRAHSQPGGACTNPAHCATLELAREPPISGPDLESLLRSAADIQLPIRQLSSWIIGREHPEKNIATTADPDTNSDKTRIITNPQSGRISQINQDGWTILYPEYRVENNLTLPRKILLQNHSIQIRLVISRWELTPPK